MEEALAAVAEADELSDLADRLEDLPAIANTQRSATYLLLRQLVLEVAGLRKDLADRNRAA